MFFGESTLWMAWEEHSQRVGFWKELSLESFLALDIQFCIHDFFMKLVISKVFSSEKFYTNNNFLKNDKTWSLVFSEIWPVTKETENIVPRIWIQDSESLCFSFSHLAHHWHQNRAGACVYCPDLGVDVCHLLQREHTVKGLCMERQEGCCLVLNSFEAKGKPKCHR